MAYCSKCGTKLNEGARFCAKCGASVGFASSNIKERNSSKKTKWAVYCFVLVGLAVGGWLMWNYMKNDYSLEGLAKAAVNYDYIDNFYDGMAKVTKGDKIGYIDKKGNEVIPCIYDPLDIEANSYFSDGLALVNKDNDYFYINKKGEKAFPFDYDWTEGFSEGFALVSKNDKYGFIDTNGEEVVPLIYDYANSFSDGMAAVMKGDKYGYVDIKGNVVIPITYDSNVIEACSFSEGLAPIEKNGKIGFIDKSGNEVIPCKYNEAYNFSEGLAVIGINEKYGFIDKNGNEVIPCTFDSADSFSDGNALVKKDGKCMVIDKSGKVVFTTSDDLIRFKEGLARVSSSNSSNSDKTGFVDVNGKEVIPRIYNTWNDFSEGLVAVSKDGINGFVDNNGKSTFDFLSSEVVSQINEKKRIEEEENKPSNRFYSIASQNLYVWQCKNGYFVDRSRYFYWRPNRLFLYFYPSSKKGGSVTVATWYNEDFFVATFTGKVSYIVADDCIFFTYRKNGVDGTTEYRLNIENDGDRVKLIRSDGQIYNQTTIDIKDPL